MTSQAAVLSSITAGIELSTALSALWLGKTYPTPYLIQTFLSKGLEFYYIYMHSNFRSLHLQHMDISTE